MNEVENASGAQHPRGSAGSKDDAGRKVILLVEDTEADRDLYGSLLWYNGFNVLHAATGEEAVTLALEAKPDLILLDMMLPGELTGLDVAASLRAEGLDRPMIVLSALSRQELGPASSGIEITAYLEKPIDPFAVVREVIRHVGTAQDREG